MDAIISNLEKLKTGDKYHDYCITDAIFHITKAKEAMEDGLADPEQWYNDSLKVAKLFVPFVHFCYTSSLSS